MSSVLHSLKNSVTGHHESGSKPSTSAIHDTKTANKLDPRVNADEADRAAKNKSQNAGKNVGTEGKRSAKETAKDWKAEASDDVKQGGHDAKEKLTPGQHKGSASKPEKGADSGLDGDKKNVGTTGKSTGGKSTGTYDGTSPKTHLTEDSGKDDLGGLGGTQANRKSSQTGSKSDTIGSNKSVRGYRGGTSGTTGSSADGVSDGYDEFAPKSTGKKSTDMSSTGPAGSYVTAGTGRDSQTESHPSDKHGHGTRSGSHPGIVGRYHIAADDPTIAHHKVDEDMIGNKSSYDERLDDRSSSRGEGFYNIPPEDVSNVGKSGNTNNLRPDLDQGHDVRDLHSQF